MAANGSSLANGADLLQRLVDFRRAGPGSVAAEYRGKFENCRAQCAIREKSVLDGGSPDTSGTLLNTYA